jgi:hypothetical protein
MESTDPYGWNFAAVTRRLSAGGTLVCGTRAERRPSYIPKVAVEPVVRFLYRAKAHSGKNFA